MYGDLIIDNDVAKLKMARADYEATQGWQFRHHKGVESRILSAVWARAKGLARRALTLDKPSIAPARKRLSY